MATVLCDERITCPCRKALSDMGFDVITVPGCRDLPEPISSHTDMVIFTDGKALITTEKYKSENEGLFSFLESTLTDIKFIYTNERFCKKYPEDAILNALKINNLLFAKTDSCSRTLLEYAKFENIEIIPTRQGYPACTALSFGKSAVTADRGIAELLRKSGIDVTLISDSGKISLPPYSFGFIGGCAGVYNSKVYFLGNLACHPDAAIIEKSIKTAGFEVISLDPHADCLYDFGGLRFFD
jgi:hypothetical protein